jgi:hypothetical protein
VVALDEVAAAIMVRVLAQVAGQMPSQELLRSEANALSELTQARASMRDHE